MKIVLVKERGTVRILEGSGKVNETELSLRNRFAGDGIEYYELDYPEDKVCPLEGFIIVLNSHPHLLETSKMVRRL